MEQPHVKDIHGAHMLAWLGDSITTDHISPAGNIAADSPAGKPLIERGVAVRDFNSYGSRRGNDQVLTRGKFANIYLKNMLVPGLEGGVTRHIPDGAEMSIYEAEMMYQGEGAPVIIIAGKEYGTGFSRDWAAKGTLLLGVRTVIAESFERIHRSNLVGMGVLPLQFEIGQNAERLGLHGDEVFDITGLSDDMAPQSLVTVRAKKANGKESRFRVKALLNTPMEEVYFRNGGILHTVMRDLLRS